MKSLSLLQPWASLIIMRQKRLETRSWKTTYRGPLLIHASSKLPSGVQAKEFARYPNFKNIIEDMYELPYGAVIGMVNLVGIYPTEDVTGETLMNMGFSDQERAFGDYTPGRYAWALEDVLPFEKPIPYKGSLSLWEFPDELLP